MTDTDSDRSRPRPEETDLPARQEVEAALEGLVRAVLPRDPRRLRNPPETSDAGAPHLAGKFPTRLKFAVKRDH